MTYAVVFYELDEELLRREGPEAPAYWGAWSAYIELLAQEGVLVPGAGAALHAPTMATSVRVRESRRVVQDGPIPDTKEQLGGMVLIEVESLDQAIGWAEKAPCAAGGGVEIRPVLSPPSS